MKSTGHKPSEKIETCYNCQAEFSSYRQLMNHRKLEHPSRKICRYFLKQECVFDDETCWYVHNAGHTMNTKEGDNFNEVDFQAAIQKAPPYQMTNMLRMIMKELQKITLGQTVGIQN